jgi:hypothetical protein
MQYDAVTFLESLFRGPADASIEQGSPPTAYPSTQTPECQVVPPTSSAVSPLLQRWDGESATLIAWFQAERTRLPMEPFRLTRWLFISNPAKCYASLQQDIAAGPRGVRARMGTLQEDLRLLREYLEQQL